MVYGKELSSQDIYKILQQKLKYYQQVEKRSGINTKSSQTLLKGLIGKIQKEIKNESIR